MFWGGGAESEGSGRCLWCVCVCTCGCEGFRFGEGGWGGVGSEGSGCCSLLLARQLLWQNQQAPFTVCPAAPPPPSLPAPQTEAGTGRQAIEQQPPLTFATPQ